MVELTIRPEDVRSALDEFVACLLYTSDAADEL